MGNYIYIHFLHINSHKNIAVMNSKNINVGFYAVSEIPCQKRVLEPKYFDPRIIVHTHKFWCWQQDHLRKTLSASLLCCLAGIHVHDTMVAGKTRPLCPCAAGNKFKSAGIWS